MLNKAKPTKTIGTAPVSASSAGVTQVYLVRGRIYFYKNIEFNVEQEHGVILEDHVPEGEDKVSWVEKTAKELEELHAIITDADGEQFEKPLFEVVYDATRPDTKAVERARAPQRTRLPVRPLRRPS